MENDVSLEDLVNHKEDVEISSNEDKLELNSGDDSFTLSLRRSGFDEEKEFFKYIKVCERLVRGCTEYSEWRKFIKEVLGLNDCVLTQESGSEIDLDIHHHPISLFTIIKCVVLSKMNKQKDFCSFDICQEVMDLHYKNHIGYMILNKLHHKKFHDGFMKLPIDFVKGNYKQFLNSYEIDEDDMKVIGSYMTTTKEELKLRWSKDNYPGIMNG